MRGTFHRKLRVAGHAPGGPRANERDQHRVEANAVARDAGAAWRLMRHEGHIEAGGVGKDVSFVAEADADINHRIDAAYRTKYRPHGGRYVDPKVAPTARATTIKLVPR